MVITSCFAIRTRENERYFQWDIVPVQPSRKVGKNAAIVPFLLSQRHIHLGHWARFVICEIGFANGNIIFRLAVYFFESQYHTFGIVAAFYDNKNMFALCLYRVFGIISAL
jgi:hypothetical protein